MHWGIYVLMGITFSYPMSGVLFAPFFRVERVTQWLWPAAAHRKDVRVVTERLSIEGPKSPDELRH